MKTPYSLVIVAGLLMLGAGCAEKAPDSVSDKGNDIPEIARTSEVRIDLSGKGLEKVPSYVFDKTDAEALDLSDNRLTGALPAEIRRLKDLRTLNASGNDMTGVPAEIGQLVNLQDLDLSENMLTGLPQELGNLVNLRRLDLRGNTISKQDLDAIRAKLKGTEILE